MVECTPFPVVNTDCYISATTAIRRRQPRRSRHRSRTHHTISESVPHDRCRPRKRSAATKLAADWSPPTAGDLPVALAEDAPVPLQNVVDDGDDEAAAAEHRECVLGQCDK